MRDSGEGDPGREPAAHLRAILHDQGRWSNVGLGLSSSYRIVAEHGGRIDVETESAQGSTFTVRLPPLGGGGGVDGHDRRARTVGLLGARRVHLLAATGAAYALILGPPPGERAPVVTLVDEPPPSIVPASTPRAAPLSLAFAEVVGDVTLVRDGLASPARKGDVLLEADAVVTAADARVEIAGGPYSLALEEAGRLEVEAAAPALARVRLASGLVSARVAGGAFEIAGVPGTSVRSEGGALSVACDGEALSAGAREGRAELRNPVGTVELSAGEQAVARQNRRLPCRARSPDRWRCT